MLGIVGVVAFLTVLGLSLVITKLATVALTFTGLSEEAARFQARSAFTGTGFTTGESKKVVDHPARRRIILLLMTLRSAGLMTIIISLILTLGTGGDESSLKGRLFWLIGGVIVLGLLAKSKPLNAVLYRIMKWALAKWTELDTRDYAGLLKLSGDYAVTELQIKKGDWLEGKKLAECDLFEEGLTVLGITRSDGGYVGVPAAETEIYKGDTLIIYGRSKAVEELDKRRADPSGELAHREAKEEQKRHKDEQDRQEREFKEKREIRIFDQIDKR
jgi:hypothetical protein